MRRSKPGAPAVKAHREEPGQNTKTVGVFRRSRSERLGELRHLGRHLPARPRRHRRAPEGAAMSEELRINGSLRPPLLSRDSGPGLRWLLFLQGCIRPCTDQCLNPHYLDSKGGRLVSHEELRLVAGQVAVGTYGPVEGITLLGGEPTDQAVALRPLLSAIRDLGMSVMLYSGHPLAGFD